MIRSLISDKIYEKPSITKSATSVTGTAYPSGAPEFTPGF
jgi:hypothetical protein